MGIFGRKKIRKECDWCSATFEGAGISVGEMRFCTDACANAQGAPPVEAAPREASAGGRATSVPLVESELRIAVSEVDHYEKVLDEIERTINLEILEERALAARATYLGIWEHLDTVRNFVLHQGGDVTGYDAVRSVSLEHLEAYSESTGLAVSGNVVTRGSVKVDRRNVEKARQALAAIGREFTRLTDINP